MDKINSFKDLKVWRKGIDLVKEIYKLCEKFPKDELYGLSSQIKRAAASIPSNIAEGFRRTHSKEHKQFYNVALGSCAELETQLIIAKELNFVSEDKLLAANDMIDHICGMLVNLSKRL